MLLLTDCIIISIIHKECCGSHKVNMFQRWLLSENSHVYTPPTCNTYIYTEFCPRVGCRMGMEQRAELPDHGIWCHDGIFHGCLCHSCLAFLLLNITHRLTCAHKKQSLPSFWFKHCLYSFGSSCIASITTCAHPLKKNVDVWSSDKYKRLVYHITLLSYIWFTLDRDSSRSTKSWQTPWCIVMHKYAIASNSTSILHLPFSFLLFFFTRSMLTTEQGGKQSSSRIMLRGNTFLYSVAAFAALGQFLFGCKEWQQFWYSIYSKHLHIDFLMK